MPESAWTANKYCKWAVCTLQFHYVQFGWWCCRGFAWMWIVSSPQPLGTHNVLSC